MLVMETLQAVRWKVLTTRGRRRETRSFLYIHRPIARSTNPWAPTFVPVVGTDGENGEAYVGVLVHVYFIRHLCKRRLVVVHVADEDANICRVWKWKGTKEREREKEEEGNHKHQDVVILLPWTSVISPSGRVTRLATSTSLRTYIHTQTAFLPAHRQEHKEHPLSAVCHF